MLNREQSSSQGGVERRQFIVRSIYTLLSIISTTLLGSIGRYLTGTPRQTENATWCDAGDISDLRTGAPQLVTFERARIDAWKVHDEKSSAWVVINDNRTSVTAFSPLCTHLGCAYKWEGSRKVFVCPCHGSCFSAQGAVLKGPAARPLDRYTVKLEGTRLWLGPIADSQNS
jgi:menaquinol-cytochrome c reductase iron-sulfur subunit